MNKLAIGVDLGGTNLRIAAVDEQGTLVEKVTLGTKVSLGRDHVIGDMCDAIQLLSDKYRNSAPLLGIGVGGGLVQGGQIWRGANGMAGEFGHTTVEPDGHPCGCGNRGCLVQYAWASAVVRMAREAIASDGAPALARAAQSDPEFSAKSIYNLAIQGDEDARRIFRYVGRCLGIVLSAMVNSLNLPIYVIGGGVASAWEAFSPAIFAELRARSMVYAATAPPDASASHEGASEHVKAGPGHKTIITRALLGSDAGLYGAARLPMIAEARS